MTYRGRGQPGPLRREIDPYALVHRWGWWYVVGFCHLRSAVRSFRVDRIVELSLLETVFDVPESFHVREYFANEPHTQPRVTVRMRFSSENALQAMDARAFWDEINEREDGSLEVSFMVPDLEWALSTALGYGPGVVVLEPDELRCLLRERARAIADQYGSVDRCDAR